MVARKAFALGFKIAACDVADVPDGTERRALADLLASSDVVSLRPPLAAQTRHFIGGAELDLTRSVRPGQHGMRSTVDEERAGRRAAHRQDRAEGAQTLAGPTPAATRAVVRTQE